VGTISGIEIVADDGKASGRTSVTFVVQSNPPAPLTKFPIPGVLGELLFDPSRGLLYAANATFNRIEVIHVGTATRRDPIPVGSGPRGIDLDLSGASLLVCPRSSDFVERVDLTTPVPSLLARLPVPSSGSGDTNRPTEISTASHGRAFFFTGGTGWGRIREWDLSTNAILVRPDRGLISTPGWVRPSGDRSRLIFGQGDITSGPIFTYQVSGDLFSPDVDTNSMLNSVDADGDGGRFMAGLLNPPGGRFFNSSLLQIGATGASVHGTAFRPGAAQAWYHSNGLVLTSVDLNGFTDSGGLSLPETATGRMRIDASGTRLAVVTATGICLITLP